MKAHFKTKLFKERAKESCFNCVHQNIQERSHEWIECKCKLDDVWRDPFMGCDKCEEMKQEESDE